MVRRSPQTPYRKAAGLQLPDQTVWKHELLLEKVQWAEIKDRKEQVGQTLCLEIQSIGLEVSEAGPQLSKVLCGFGRIEQEIARLVKPVLIQNLIFAVPKEVIWWPIQSVRSQN